MIPFFKLKDIKRAQQSKTLYIPPRAVFTRRVPQVEEQQVIVEDQEPIQQEKEAPKIILSPDESLRNPQKQTNFFINTPMKTIEPPLVRFPRNAAFLKAFFTALEDPADIGRFPLFNPDGVARKKFVQLKVSNWFNDLAKVGIRDNMDFYMDNGLIPLDDILNGEIVYERRGEVVPGGTKEDVFQLQMRYFRDGLYSVTQDNVVFIFTFYSLERGIQGGAKIGITSDMQHAQIRYNTNRSPEAFLNITKEISPEFRDRVIYDEQVGAFKVVQLAAEDFYLDDDDLVSYLKVASEPGFIGGFDETWISNFIGGFDQLGDWEYPSYLERNVENWVKLQSFQGLWSQNSPRYRIDYTTRPVMAMTEMLMPEVSSSYIGGYVSGSDLVSTVFDSSFPTKINKDLFEKYLQYYSNKSSGLPVGLDPRYPSTSTNKKIHGGRR